MRSNVNVDAVFSMMIRTLERKHACGFSEELKVLMTVGYWGLAEAQGFIRASFRR